MFHHSSLGTKIHTSKYSLSLSPTNRSIGSAQWFAGLCRYSRMANKNQLITDVVRNIHKRTTTNTKVTFFLFKENEISNCKFEDAHIQSEWLEQLTGCCTWKRKMTKKTYPLSVYCKHTQMGPIIWTIQWIDRYINKVVSGIVLQRKTNQKKEKRKKRWAVNIRHIHQTAQNKKGVGGQNSINIGHKIL